MPIDSSRFVTIFVVAKCRLSSPSIEKKPSGAKVLGDFRFGNKYEISYEYEFTNGFYCVVETGFQSTSCFYRCFNLFKGMQFMINDTQKANFKTRSLCQICSPITIQKRYGSAIESIKD